MSVTFQLPSDRGLGLIGFGWSPLLEAALSLKCVVHPKRYPMHLPWARRCRDLPEDLRAEVRLVARHFDRFLPGVFEVGLLGDHAGFDEELAALAALDDATVTYELSLGFGGMGCADDHDRSVLDDPGYRDRVVAQAGAEDPDYATVVAQAFDDPAALRARLVTMLQRYWDEAFADEWDRLLPRIEAEVTSGSRALVTRGAAGLVDDFLPECRWDDAETAIVLDKEWSQTCDVAERGGMLLVPTVYGWPRVLVELAPPWPVSVMLPLRDMRQPEVPHATDHEVADGLRALGDETRLQITRLVAEQPRSTRELAELLRLSDSAVSRHLRTLAAAGVVDSQRDGYFVLYRLVPERIGALGGALRRTLGLAAVAQGPATALPVSVPRRDDPPHRRVG